MTQHTITMDAYLINSKKTKQIKQPFLKINQHETFKKDKTTGKFDAFIFRDSVYRAGYFFF